MDGRHELRLRSRACRGDRREAIFKGDKDWQGYPVTLDEACEKTGWQVHAFCLMPNHFRLLLETPQGNLVVGIKWLSGLARGGSTGGASYFSICSVDETKR